MSGKLGLRRREEVQYRVNMEEKGGGVRTGRRRWELTAPKRAMAGLWRVRLAKELTVSEMRE